MTVNIEHVLQQLIVCFWFIQISGFIIVNSIVISLASDVTESEDAPDTHDDEQGERGQAVSG